MASSSRHDQDHPPKNDDAQASSDGNHTTRQSFQSPAMGYPPSIGYPYPSAPHGYPNNSYYDTEFHCGQVAAAPQPSRVFYPPQPERKLSGFLRGLIGGLIFLILFACIISIITWLILHPHLPVFHVNSFYVSNFNISAANFTAEWDANVTVRNPNSKLQLYFYKVQVFVYSGEDRLASTPVDPFPLNTKESRLMVVKLSPENGTGSDEAVEKMAAERSKSGKVSFGLRMGVWGTFKSGKWWERNVLIKVNCDDLQVEFVVNNSGNGSLANGNSLSDCVATA